MPQRRESASTLLTGKYNLLVTRDIERHEQRRRTMEHRTGQGRKYGRPAGRARRTDRPVAPPHPTEGGGDEED